MDGLIVAWRSFLAAHKFLFWALVALVARWWVELLHAINWYQEASREMLVLSPRRPKDVYDNGYALFAYDLGADCWVGHWREPNALPGQPGAETYAWRESWSGIPFHEVNFTDMPQITFKVRAVSLAWCRKHLKLGDGAEVMKAVSEQVGKALDAAASREAAQVAAAEAAQATKH